MKKSMTVLALVCLCSLCFAEDIQPDPTLPDSAKTDSARSDTAGSQADEPDAAGPEAVLPDTPSGFPIRFVGGMGLAIWPMELKLTQRVHTNVGLGISGRLMVKVGDHLRLQAGLFQGNFGEEDKTQVQRNFIFAGIEGSVQLPADFYLNLGARFGGSHLEMVETLQRKKDDQRLVNDIDIWSPMVQPIVAAGCLLKKKYHVEVEAGTALTYIEGGWQVSYTALVGVYFAMGGFEI